MKRDGAFSWALGLDPDDGLIEIRLGILQDHVLDRRAWLLDHRFDLNRPFCRHGLAGGLDTGTLARGGVALDLNRTIGLIRHRINGDIVCLCGVKIEMDVPWHSEVS